MKPKPQDREVKTGMLEHILIELVIVVVNVRLSASYTGRGVLAGSSHD